MSDRSTPLAPDEFAAVFPFHVVVGRDLSVLQTGAAIAHLLPRLRAGEPLLEHFSVLRPADADSFDAIVSRSASLFLLRSRERDTLTLRGQMLPVQQGMAIAFLGSPWVRSLVELEALQLSLTDFALHDAAGDLLFLLQAQASGLRDVHDLAGQLQALNATLEARVEERTEALSAINEQLAARTRELELSEQRYRSLFEKHPLPMWLFDRETLRFLEVNDAAIEGYGYSREEFLAMRITEIRPPEDVPRLLGYLPAAEQRWRHAGHWRHRLKSGRVIDVELLSHQVAVDGRDARLVMAHDVTDRRKAEAALMASEDRFRRIAETITEVFWMADAAVQTMIYVSPAYERIWGRSRDSLYREPRSFLDAVHPDDRERVSAQVALQSTGQPFEHEYRIIRPDGEIRWIWDRAYPIPNPDGPVRQYVGAAQDVTDRVRAVEAVREAEERMRFALESARIGVWEANLVTGESYWSETCEALHGLPRGSFDRTFDAFVACIHPEDRDQIQKAVDDAVREHREADLEYRTPWPDGTERRIRATARFYYDEKGVPTRGAGIAVDVTQRRELEDQLRQAQRLEAVGRLAGGIAHDFNNILTAILGNAAFLQGDLPDTDPHRRDVEEIIKAGQRAATLTRQLLAFSRRQIVRPRVLHLGETVGEIAPMLGRLLGETIEIVTTPRDQGRVKADAGQMEQVLVNLAVNARDAMRDGGRLTIETSDAIVDAGFARQHPGLQPGPYVVIAVRDTGTGMDAQTQRQVFEPFFTTKPRGQGTGLGLATVFGIVKQHGGHVQLESSVGRGSTFTVYLPRTDEVDEIPAVAPPNLGALAGRETILLVEDEPPVREFVSRVLARYGYTVHAVGDPRLAIEFADAHTGPLDLVLTDVVLPGMNGRVMATRVLERHPDSQVLYMSGYTDDAIVRQGVLEAGTSFLEKPFTSETLLKRVRDLLRSGSGPEATRPSAGANP